MGAWAVVVAAGSGTRFGGPKQYQALAGRRVLDWSLDAVVPAVDGIVLVVGPDRVADPEPAATHVVAGGTTRSESVRNGLAAVPADADVIVVHDAARPLASTSLAAAVVAAVRGGADAAIPGLAVADTIKQVDAAGGVVTTLDRAALVAVQTPQAFAARALRAAHAGGGEATDDAALVEQRGGKVVVVPGEPENTKITEAADLPLAASRLGARSAVRVGQGFDVHAYSDDPARRLVLGGVHFPDERGLAGHSDADVVAHAAIDALLGAAGLGDIGSHFPDTDPALAGADSLELLRQAADLVRAEGAVPGNIDCTVVLDAPKLAPRRDEMQERLRAAAGVDVTVKGKRSEGVGAFGRREGVACWAVAVVTMAAR